MKRRDLSRILDWPGYRVYRFELEESSKRLRLWVRRKAGRRWKCSGCGRGFTRYHDVTEREVRDLPWAQYRVTVVVEVHRVRCPQCGVKVEKIPQVPSKSPFSLRFEDAVGQACEAAPARQVARQWGLAESTVRAIDLRCLERWAAGRSRPKLRHLGVDEIYLGKRIKFLTVVSNLESGEPLWFGRERKKETLDQFFRGELSAEERGQIEAVCVDMWEPFTQSIREWLHQAKIIYDKFHIMQHANDAVDEVRRAEFFRQGGEKREVVKGKRWLLLSRWKNLDRDQRGQLQRLFRMNRRILKAYLLKEDLERLWDFFYEGAMRRYLNNWISQLRWQRLPAFDKLAWMLHDHWEGILNYCRTPVRFGVVEAVNGNLQALVRRGRGYQNLRYLLLKAQRLAALRAESQILREAA